MLLKTSDIGYISTCEALGSFDNRMLLPLIKKPTLVIAGLQDQSTPVAACEFIANEIPGGKLEIIDAAHISNVEESDTFLRRVLEFLDDESR
jgi:3-oxoadipate enol-lactonase